MRHKTRHVWDAFFGRGELADRIPNWLVRPVRFGYLIIHEFSRNRCPEKASALGFQTVFSLIPAFALALVFFRVFGDFSDLGPQVQQFIYRRLNIDEIYLKNPDESESTSGGASTQPIAQESKGSANESQDGSELKAVALDEEIQRLVDGVYDKLSTGGLSIVSFFWLVVAALQMVLTLEKSLNEIWGSAAQRNLLRRVIVYWCVLTMGPLLIGLSLYMAKQIRVDALDSRVVELAIEVLGPLVALFLIYKLMPVAPVHFLPAVVGAFFAAVLLQLARVLFRLYLQNAVGYEKLYGNLGLLPVSLFWLWINWVIVLIGAEVGYTLQNLERLTAEERRRHGAPFIHPGLVALGLVLHAGRAFDSGHGPVDADELAESTGLPDHVWMRLVDLLQEQGILIQTELDRPRFIPGRPLESLRVEDVFAAVEDSLIAHPTESGHPEEEQLLNISNLLTEARRRELGQKSIADLLRAEDAGKLEALQG
jgi:membrane protein